MVGTNNTLHRVLSSLLNISRAYSPHSPFFLLTCCLESRLKIRAQNGSVFNSSLSQFFQVKVTLKLAPAPAAINIPAFKSIEMPKETLTSSGYTNKKYLYE
jgi:hypothetical protein